MHPFFRSLDTAYRTITTIAPDTPLPQTDADILAIQRAWMEAYGGVAAWKVAPWSAPAGMWAAPIPSRWIHASGDDFPHQAGLRIELEFALLLKRDLNGDAAISSDAVEMALAFELIRSRLPVGPIWPDRIKTADLTSSLGLVMGHRQPLPTASQAVEMTLSRPDLPDSTVSVDLDPSILLRTLCWLANHATAAGWPLKAGTIVITGARIGPTDLPIGKTHATAAGFAPISVCVSR